MPLIDMESEYDAILIGAGPAGSSVAAILAEYGRNVLASEREKLPRYAYRGIADSLHLSSAATARDDRQNEGLTLHERRYSVSFVQPDGKRSQPFYFFNRYDRETVAQTWQVLRSEFDQMMVDNAREKGAEVREETAVNRFLMDGDRVAGVECTSKDGTTYEVRSAITLDCTGKEAMASNQRGWRVGDPLNKVAVWIDYKGSRREPDIDGRRHDRGFRTGQRLVLAYSPAQ